MTPIRIFLVDDHQSVLEGFSLAFGTFDDIIVVGMSTDPTSALNEIVQRAEEIDLVVSDYQMPGIDGIMLSKAIKAKAPYIKTFLLTMFSLIELSEKARKNGLDGYAPKSEGIEEIVASIRSVMTNQFVGLVPLKAETDRSNGRNPAITRTELKVICCIVKLELTSRQIASKLFVTEDTVESHRKSIMSKLGAHNVVGIANYAYRIGIVPSAGVDCPCEEILR